MAKRTKQSGPAAKKAPKMSSTSSSTPPLAPSSKVRTKAMTIRLSAQQAEQLETVARVDDQPIAAVIRTAIEEHIAARKSDKEFRRSLRERLKRTEKFLKG